MPRTARCAPGGMLFHVLNRGNARAQIFDDDEDDHALQRVLTETLSHVPMRVLAYCLIPNHWHLVLWPREDGHLGEFMRMRASVARGRPYGPASWQRRVAVTAGVGIHLPVSRPAAEEMIKIQSMAIGLIPFSSSAA